MGNSGFAGTLKNAVDIRVEAVDSSWVWKERRDLPPYRFPVAPFGMRLGLLGGSFDPPHAGHVHISRAALRRFGLDHVWWLVSPGNPLKPNPPAPLAQRVDRARREMAHPHVTVTAVETLLNTRYTAETLRGLRQRYPGVRQVWLMGADNLAEFHRWEHWQDIMNTVPVGVLARPGERTAARHSVAAKRFKQAQLKDRYSMLLPTRKPPCWCFINVPMVDLSSSAIRARGQW